MAEVSVQLPTIGDSVHVKVPASSANLGPGFDTLGLAVSLYDDVTFTVIPQGIKISITGEGAGELPEDESHLIAHVVKKTLTGIEPGLAEKIPGLSIECVNRIPQSRGLGSSAAAIVAGVAGANALVGEPLSMDDMIQQASAYEGHPDNAAASLLGDMVVSWTEYPDPKVPDSQAHFSAVKVPVSSDLHATAFIPSDTASTHEVRKVIPAEVPHKDASFNAARTALMAIAIQNRPEYLMEATRDALHQPYRAEVLGTSFKWIEKMRDAGYPAYLSGAGSTVMVLSPREVRQDLIAQAQAEGLDVQKLHPSNGVEVHITQN